MMAPGSEPLVRKERLELSRVTPLASKASASTIPPLSLVGGLSEGSAIIAKIGRLRRLIAHCSKQCGVKASGTMTA